MIASLRRANGNAGNLIYVDQFLILKERYKAKRHLKRNFMFHDIIYIYNVTCCISFTLPIKVNCQLEVKM